MENQSIPLYDSDTVTIEQNPLDNSITLHSKEKYQIDEKVIGTWLDNKPIYRKVIKTYINQSDVSITHNIENLDLVIDKRILLKGPNYTAVNTNMATTGNYIYNWIISNTSIRIYNSINFSGDCYIILEYTKTTD